MADVTLTNNSPSDTQVTTNEETKEPAKSNSNIQALAIKYEREKSHKALMQIVFSLSLMTLLIGMALTIMPKSFVTTFQDITVPTVFEGDTAFRAKRSDELKQEMIESAQGSFQIFGVFTIIMSIAGFSYFYTSGGVFFIRHGSLRAASSSATDTAPDLLAAMLEIQSLVEHGRLQTILSDQERKEIVDHIAEVVEKQLNKNLVSQIENKYGLSVRNNLISKFVDEVSNKTTIRLQNSHVDLTRKANVNLLFGIMSIVIGIGVLVTMIMTYEAPEPSSPFTNWFYLASRFSVFLVIETVGVFFLRLYRSTLIDIKYTNNEITNAEMRLSALDVALKFGDAGMIKLVITEIARTERNFVLKKGESSVFTEANNAETITLSAIEKIVSVLPGISTSKPSS